MYQCLLALCLLCAAQAETLEVGAFSVAPWIIATGNDKVSGALVDFYNQDVAPRAGVTLRWHGAVTVSRLVEDLRLGKLQFSPILTRTPERLQQLRFGSTLVTRFEPCLAVLPSSPLKQLNRPEDLDGFTIGWTVGGKSPDFLDKPSINMDRTGVPEWELANLGKLRLGRIDAAYFSNPLTPLFFRPIASVQYRLVKIPVPPIALYPVYPPDTDPALVARMDKAIAKALSEGRLERHLSNYLPTE
ncbi:substrate-binding periplasmic protein [Chitinimonas sp. JJ19]|uniref:substrate-binding periplasmic protein n=1 Tax=Chitinimonas sp. JJ19 TaxID=3109352 RepID=UPI003000745C